MSQARFQKRMREKARQEKQAAKRARKEERALEADAEAETAEAEPVADQEQVIARLAALHQKFDDDQIDFDEFEEAKQQLVEQLQVE